MQLSAILLSLSATAGVMADLHKQANCYSHIQPIGNDIACPRKRDADMFQEGMHIVKRAYGDNAAVTIRACAAYRNCNTRTKQWDTCPDCHVIKVKSNDIECINYCQSDGKHIGGDEWEYYCKQAGANGAYAI